MTYQSDEAYARSLQAQFDQVPEITLTSTLQKVLTLPTSTDAIRIADNFGLSITDVTWEDNARNKGSSFGPCISDMTLNVLGSNLPVIRSPNYEDLTWDVQLDAIPLMVGNEHGQVMFETNLKEYLENFRDYLYRPGSWKGNGRSLLRDEDQWGIMSSQACFLPVHANGGETPFNVSLFNYQTRANDPAVLVIVASNNGTSAQIVDSRGDQKLYFNQNGEKCSFIGKRLSQHRVEEGRENDGSPMTSEEKQKNALLIIQVPLKQKQSMPTLNYDSFYDLESMPMMSANSAIPQSFMKRSRSIQVQEEVDVEDAILSIGESEGEFREVGDLEIERDERYPIRITLQYYKATSNGVVDDDIMAQIYQQLVDSRDFGTNVGSLVVGGDTGRPTEFTTKYGGYNLPQWWDEFWLMYGNIFSQYTKESAADKIFLNGRFCQSTLSQSKSKILSILGDGEEEKTTPTPPKWTLFD